MLKYILNGAAIMSSESLELITKNNIDIKFG